MNNNKKNHTTLIQCWKHTSPAVTKQLTYLCVIWCLSCGSSSMLTDRSEIETAAEAVRVTRSTRTPSPSSSGMSNLCVCSLLRSDKSTVHLKKKEALTETHKNSLQTVLKHRRYKLYNGSSFGITIKKMAFSQDACKYVTHVGNYFSLYKWCVFVSVYWSH